MSFPAAPKFPAVSRLFTLIVLAIAAVTAGLAQSVVNPAPASAAVSSPFWIANPQGSVWNFGGAPSYGDVGGKPLNKPIIGIAPTPTGRGYYLVATDGGIFSYGDATFRGSTGSINLNKPIVGMASTPSNQGYWMVASDGGIFTFGDAGFFGSTGSLRLNQPIVAMEPTPTNRGYWLVASDGGIFSFGDAAFFGSTGSIRLQKPIVAMESTPSGKGYWLVASDGGVFNYGDAQFYGSMGGTTTNNYARIVSTTDGQGYWLVRNGGDAVGFGSAISNGISAVGAGTARSIPAFGLVYNISGPGDLPVHWAMGELGKPYAWGGSGPNSYDCSGLTLQAWAKAGVSLPRIANDQYNVGRKVGLDSLLPGDLVFWGSNTNDPRSIYHVAIYIGGGNVVMAPKANDVVKTTAIWSADLMPLAVRPRG